MLGQLRDIVEQVGKAKNLSEAMDKLVQLTKSNMQVDCCSIYLTDQKASRLNLIASEGLASQAVGKTHLNFKEGIVGLVHDKGEPLNLGYVSEHPHFKYVPSSQEELFNSFLGTPIIHKRQVLGVLVVQQKTTRLFSEVEESFLITLSMHLASVLANSNFLMQFEKVNKPTSSIHLTGSPASPGIAVAEAYVVRPILTLDEVKIEQSYSIDKDLLLFEDLIKKCTEEFSSLSLTLREQVSKDAFAIFDIYSHILKDPVFLDAIRDEIKQSQLSTSSAIKVVAESYIKKFEEMGNSYLSERASDIRDVAQRMLYHLTQQVDDEIQLPGKIILVAKEVTLTMLA
ncbi:MAG: phosphoenolpyruvate-utilizing N-terminal domain-containing protein, partial [Psychromonas sp.]